MLPYFADKRWTAAGLATRIRQSYPVIDELISLATERGAAVREPFQGAEIGPFTVLSPSRSAYDRLVPQFRKTPDADLEALDRDRMLIGTSKASSLAKALAERLITWVGETWDVELLREGAVTAAENETSTVLFGRFGTEAVLLTADAGINALTWSQDYADAHYLPWSSLGLIQVPHHGSRSNVTPQVLDRLLGPKQKNATWQRKGRSVASVPKDDEKHPRKMVMNSFLRRGWPVDKTQGAYFRHHTSGFPPRPNEGTAVPFDWFSKVEEYD
jgi:hypothetical protein